MLKTLRQIARVGLVTEAPPAPDESLRQLDAMAAHSSSADNRR